jgi:beta-glucosidase
LISTFGNDPAFLWGGATAAAQIEGGWDADGKQPSIWDDFCHSTPTPSPNPDTSDPDFSKQCGNVPEGGDVERWTTLAVTDDFYHKYESDLDLLSSYNMNAMRISLSWPRVMPFNAETGQHEPNQAGIDFYKNVLRKMQANGITPVVTLFHWDLPNDLSFLRENVVEEFAKYAKLCFDEFGEWVKDWATFNEPTSSCSLGYAIGAFAPGHKETTGHLKCGKNLLVSHARAVEEFRSGGYDGQIGIVLDYKWAYPDDPNDADDVKMAGWDFDNVVGFWAEPIFGSGDFPESLKDFFGDQMPVLTQEEQTLLAGSADFWGANTYGGKITRPKSEVLNKPLSEYNDGDDMAERYTFSPCGDCGDEPCSRDHVFNESFACGAASSWLWAFPDAMYQYLNKVKSFTDKPIYVTEFGCDVDEEGGMSFEQAYDDEFRVQYYKYYMMQIAKAKDEGADIKGVFAWSLMDNFEWGDGLNFRFGITYVDFNDDALPRKPKRSAEWWTDLIGKMNPSTVTV